MEEERDGGKERGKEERKQESMERIRDGAMEGE